MAYDYYYRPMPSAGASYLSSAYMNVGGFNLPSAMLSPTAIGNLMKYNEIATPSNINKDNATNTKTPTTTPKKTTASNKKTTNKKTTTKKATPKKTPARRKRKA